MKTYSIVSIVFTLQITSDIYSMAVEIGELGSSCAADRDCKAENSRCYQKICSCLPFYAAYNSTICLQSNMLGFECLISEQCSKKVANSSCIGGICRCEPGFLQFRRHTCLTAAKIGEICYSDNHCRLWDGDSHCDFMIANLFGRCVCNAPLRQSHLGTCLPVSPSSSAGASSTSHLSGTKTDDRKPEVANKTTSPNKVTSSTSSSHNAGQKLQGQKKMPPKLKPDHHKPINRTDRPDLNHNKVKPGHKPSSKPDHQQRPVKPADVKPAKPDRNVSKPAKKPDQKLQLAQQLINKTQQKLDELDDKIPTFHPSTAATKPLKHSQSTSKPPRTSTEKSKGTSTTSTTSITSITTSATSSTTSTATTPITIAPVVLVTKAPSSAKPSSKPVANFFLAASSQIKPNSRIPSTTRNETLKPLTVETMKPLSADKILVINTQPKKPPKNKFSTDNKSSLKNSFPTGLSFLGVKENFTSVEDSLLRFPTNLDKQVEIILKNENNSVFHEKVATDEPSASIIIRHRVAEKNQGSVVSLGYHCTFDSQCMRNDNNSRCINGICDCVARRTRLENTCSARNRGCHKGTFQCKSSGVCISWFFVCDGRKDCIDGSDEECKDKNTCPEHAFRCGSSVPAVCLSQAVRCDGTPDCPNGEDEFNCTATKQKGCPLHTFQCEDNRCLPEYEFCNAVISCEDGSDEPDSLCTATWSMSVRSLGYCPFRCSNGRCRSSAVVCSGRDGCGDNSDENRCSVCKCPAAA